MTDKMEFKNSRSTACCLKTAIEIEKNIDEKAEDVKIAEKTEDVEKQTEFKNKNA